MPNLLRGRSDASTRDVRAAVHAEQVRLLYRQQPLALSGSFLVILVVAGVLWDVMPRPWLLSWALVFALLTAIRAGVWRRFRNTPEEDRDYRSWARLNLTGTLLSGLIIGAVGLYPAVTGQHQALSFLVIVFTGMCATALSTNGSRLEAVLAFVLPLMLPTGLLLLVQGRGVALALGVLMLFFVLIFGVTAARFNRTFTDALRLRFRNNALYRDMARANQRVREAGSVLHEQMEQREQAERGLSAYAKRLQRANAALQREVAERERNEQQLTRQAISILESEARMRAVFQNAFDAILTLSEEGRVAACNAAAQALFGYPEGDMEGLSVEVLIPGFGGLAASGQVLEREGLRADGSRVPLACSLDRMQVGDKVQYVCIIRDETQARESKQALIQAKEAAEAANRAKSEFLSSMSHELRTPLNAILGFAQLLQTDPTEPLSEAQRESVDQIGKAGWHLLQLINDVLDLAKIESGRLDTSLEDVALLDVVQECLGLVAPNAEHRQIRVEDLGAGSEVVLRADYVRLKQVLLNLLSNAIKYNRPGGRVIIRAPECRDGRCRLAVEDTGSGLTPEQIEVIFAPFTRVAENREEIEGTGIGLTITRRLLEMMDGRVWVESEPGRGSLFWLELPLADGASPRRAASPGSGVRTGAVPEHRRRLLYVEDNPANLKLVQSIIRRQRPNIELISATDGEQGLELALTEAPDVIMLDISLPGISGFDLLEALQQDADMRRIPTIALSANAMPRDIEKGLKAGFASYLTKPIDVLKLLSTLDGLMGGGVAPGSGGGETGGAR